MRLPPSLSAKLQNVDTANVISINKQFQKLPNTFCLGKQIGLQYQKQTKTRNLVFLAPKLHNTIKKIIPNQESINLL